jgi:hypothetical protein
VVLLRFDLVLCDVIKRSMNREMREIYRIGKKYER